LLATLPNHQPIGCIAIRPLPPHHSPSETPVKKCEMKRLYLTPSSRGLGVGRALVREVIEEAKRLGYEEMRLDTLPSMVRARKLYESVGFENIDAYYETPLAGTIFLGKKLLENKN